MCEMFCSIFSTVTEWAWDQTVADDATQEVLYFTPVIPFPATLHPTTLTVFDDLIY